MRAFRAALVAAAVSLPLVLLSCDTVKPGEFDNGTYHSTATSAQTLIINGDRFTYTYWYEFAGYYTTEGNAVTFTTTKIDGEATGLNQRSTFDFTHTPDTIILTNIRVIENGGCGMSNDTFVK